MKNLLLLFVFAPLIAPTTQAQVTDSLLNVWWTSPAGFRPAGIFTDGFETGDDSAFDLNDNGSRDIPVLGYDEMGNPKKIIIYDMLLLDSAVVELDLSAPEMASVANGTTSLQGFYDLDGDQVKEIVFGGMGVVMSGGTTMVLGPAYRYLGVWDVNDDGVFDLVTRNVQTRQIVVYSSLDAGGKRAAALSP